MIEVKILNTQCGDWEGLYINGELIDEGHSLGEGNRVAYFFTLCTEHNITYDDIEFHELCDTDDTQIGNYGAMPSNLSKLTVEYNKA